MPKRLTLGGAVALLVVFVVGLFGIEVPAEVASALTLVCSVLADRWGAHASAEEHA